jgi:type VI secretion system protein ImpL
VLIDTAGRYTTQDSDAGADKAAWQGFMLLLKRRRASRSTASLTLSVQDLLSRATPSVPSWPS